MSSSSTVSNFTEGVMPVPTTLPVTTACPRAAYGRLRIISRLSWRSRGRDILTEASAEVAGDCQPYVQRPLDAAS